MFFLLWELKLLPLRCRLFEPASLRVGLKIILPIFLLLRSRFRPMCCEIDHRTIKIYVEPKNLTCSAPSTTKFYVEP